MSIFLSVVLGCFRHSRPESDFVQCKKVYTVGMVIEIGACTSWGWVGLIVGGPYTQDTWSHMEKAKHINWLEMMAVWNCLQHFFT